MGMSFSNMFQGPFGGRKRSGMAASGRQGRVFGKILAEQLGVLFGDEDGDDAVGRVDHVGVALVVEQGAGLGLLGQLDR